MKTCKTQSVVLMGRGKGAGGGEKLIPKLNPQLIIFPQENGAFSARVRALTSPFESPFNFPRAAVFHYSPTNTVNLFICLQNTKPKIENV